MHRNELWQCPHFNRLLVCTWRHGGHVGGQERKLFSPLGTKLYVHANSSRKNSIVLTTNKAALSHGCKPRIGTKSCPIQYEQQRPGDPFPESPDKFSGPKSCFMFAMFTFKIKVSNILKMIPWKYQLTKQNRTVCELGTVLLFNRFWFGPEKKNAWSRVSITLYRACRSCLACQHFDFNSVDWLSD